MNVIYKIEVLSNIFNTCIAIGLGSVIIFCLFFVSRMIDKEFNDKPIVPKIAITVPFVLMIISLIGIILIPPKDKLKEIYKNEIQQESNNTITGSWTECQ